MNEFVEIGRRIKRALDGNISYRKAVLLLFIVLVILYYIGPGTVNRLLGRTPVQDLEAGAICVQSKLSKFSTLINQYNAHQTSQLEDGTDVYGVELPPDWIHYVGNGYHGLSVSDDGLMYIKAKRTLSVAVNFKPLVHVYLEEGSEVSSGQVTDYTEGKVTTVQCHSWEESPENPVTVTSTVFAHRELHGVLVQEIKVYNPGDKPAQLSLEKLGIYQWDDATSKTKVIEHGEGGATYTIITGQVFGDRNHVTGQLSGEKSRYLVSIVSKRMESNIEVAPRMTTSIRVLTGIVYEEITKESDLDVMKEQLEAKAINEVKKAVSMTFQVLVDLHTKSWHSLWSSGFGISWSYADGAINGNRINATIYFVLSQTQTLLHSDISNSKRSELMSYLSYTEGCYAGVRTLDAKNLWTDLDTQAKMLNVAHYWLLTLEKNGCHNLLRAGADGVVQAMLLSMAGLKFSNQHLELNVHPNELHRDLMVRRVNYGNATHININIHVMEDNKAAIFVSLDKQNRDYYGCDAGCLDPPVKLGVQTVKFPVKLTDPPTAILYITADHEHMNDLKHAIHVKEVAEAPAHEQHVLELHRSGNRMGGLPLIFWLCMAALIVIFHLFLFKIVINEYCSGPDKYRIRKYSDYQ